MQWARDSKKERVPGGERERERERVPSAAPGVQARGVRFVYNLKAEVP